LDLDAVLAYTETKTLRQWPVWHWRSART